MQTTKRKLVDYARRSKLRIYASNSGDVISETGTKVSVAVAVILVLTAFVDLRISAALATAYLIGYGVNRMMRDRKRREAASGS
jgi:hypothetical protein